MTTSAFAPVKLAFTLGLSPVGSEKLGWDTVEDALGVQDRYEYMYIDADDVTARTDWKECLSVEDIACALPECFDPKPETVIMFTISVPGAQTFLAAGWTRWDEAQLMITDFLESYVLFVEVK